MKIIVRYTDPKTNKVEYIEAESIIHFAVNHLFFHIDKREDGGWEVWLVGENVAHYTNEWTYEEVIRNYFRDFEQKNNWKNIQYFKQYGIAKKNTD